MFFLECPGGSEDLANRPQDNRRSWFVPYRPSARSSLSGIVAKHAYRVKTPTDLPDAYNWTTAANQESLMPVGVSRILLIYMYYYRHVW